MRWILTAALLLGGFEARARPVDYVSSAPARQLAFLFETSGRNALAAVDPDAAGMFVAAVYVSDSLLVVRARHPAPEKATMQLRARKDHFQVYLDLIGTPTPEGMFFVRDAHADGLLSVAPGSARVDVVREHGRPEMRVDGDFEGQNMTAAAYDERLDASDVYYAQLLKVLLAAHHSSATTDRARSDR